MIVKNLIVQKYGGTSLGTPQKIKAVAKRIAAIHKKGKKLVVVTSAMGHTTDGLIDLAAQVSPSHPEVRHEREMDMLLTTGERVSMSLLSMALADLGVEAISFTGSQAGILTDSSHTRARILEIRPFRVLSELKKNKVVIVAGFQGVSTEKEITTLGRGGSDTTAVALASCLKAERCEILTDVPGVFSADPREVKKAVRYAELPLDLMVELSFFGSQVMHPRSIEIAREKKFPIYVGKAHGLLANKSGEYTMSELQKNGTMLFPKGLELPKLVGISSKSGLVWVQVAAKNALEVLEFCQKNHVLVFSYQIQAGLLELAVLPGESAPLLKKYKAKIKGKVALLTLVGHQIQGRPEVAVALFKQLHKNRAKVLGLTSQAQSITVWLSEKDLSSKLVNALHNALILGSEKQKWN